MDSVILHCDLNAFFASVACLDNPTIRFMPVAVCGSVDQRHGIVLAKNAAASKFNIKTGEAVWQARQKCPELVTVPPNYNRYREISLAARSIYGVYTDSIEPFGIDECWLDVTASGKLFGTGCLIANEIREKIKREIGVTISAGVSYNRIFAKFGSDYKKPDAITLIDKDNVGQIVWPHRVDELFGVGKNTAKTLNNMGIFTIGDLALCNPDVLKMRFGKIGPSLRARAAGVGDDMPLMFGNGEIPKSIGRSTTCTADIADRETLYNVLLVLSEDVARQLREHKLYATVIQLHTRNCDLLVKEFSEKQDSPIRISSLIAKAGIKLFDNNCSFLRPYRSVGVRAMALVPEPEGLQTSIFYNPVRQEKEEKLESKMYAIREKFGKDSIVRCCVMEEKSRPVPDEKQTGGKPTVFQF